MEEDRQQAEESFHDLDTNEDGLVTYNEITNFLQFDQNKDGVVSEDEAKVRPSPSNLRKILIEKVWNYARMENREFNAVIFAVLLGLS